MIAVLASVLLAQFTPLDPNDRAPPAALVSPSASARFALERVCGPAAQANEPIRQSRGLIPIRSQGGYHVQGVGRVIVRQAPGNACYFRVDQGDAEGLREMVLERLAAAGVQPRQMSDQRVTGAAGPFRQEIYCLSFSGRSGAMLISTALSRRGYRLQVTLAPNSERCEASRPTA